MVVIYIISIVLIFAYALIFIHAMIKWIKLKDSNRKIQRTCSIIIPFRNEEHRISPLLRTLNKLDGKFEVIFVDDFSNDNTVGVIRRTINSNLDFKIITNTQQGKKRAIDTGVNQAKFEWVLTTDADCEVPNDWLCFPDCPEQFIKAPVLFKSPAKYFHYLSIIENLMLTPFLMCYSKLLASGANLSYSKKLYEEKNPYQSNYQIPSGDDMFFLENVDKGEINIRWNTVQTALPNTYLETLYQGARWAGKSKQLKNKAVKYVGSIVFVTNFWMILLLIASFINFKNFIFFSVFFLIKFLIDFLLLFLVTHKFKRTNYLKYSFVVEIVYPLHLVLILILSLLQPIYWKGRRINGE